MPQNNSVIFPYRQLLEAGFPKVHIVSCVKRLERSIIDLSNENVKPEDKVIALNEICSFLKEIE